MNARVKGKTILLIIFLLIVVSTLIFFLFKPIDSFGYATSGCVGLGTSVHENQRYSIIKGDRSKFYEDKNSVDPLKVQFMQALCESDTKTHTLYIL